MIFVDDLCLMIFLNFFFRFVEILLDLGLLFNVKLVIMFFCVYLCVFYV